MSNLVQHCTTMNKIVNDSKQLWIMTWCNGFESFAVLVQGNCWRSCQKKPIHIKHLYYFEIFRILQCWWCRENDRTNDAVTAMQQLKHMPIGYLATNSGHQAATQFGNVALGAPLSYHVCITIHFILIQDTTYDAAFISTMIVFYWRSKSDIKFVKLAISSRILQCHLQNHSLNYSFTTVRSK